MRPPNGSRRCRRLREANHSSITGTGAHLDLRPGPAGRPALRARRALRATGDLRGQALTLDAIVTGYYYVGRISPRSIAGCRNSSVLLGDRGTVLNRESALRARAAYAHRAPLPPAGRRRTSTHCAHRLDEFIDGSRTPTSDHGRIDTVHLPQLDVRMVTAADALVARIQPFLAGAEMTPLMQIWWRAHLAYWRYVAGATTSTAVIHGPVDRRTLRSGRLPALEIDHAETAALIARATARGGEPGIDAMERRLSPTRRMDCCLFPPLAFQPGAAHRPRRAARSTMRSAPRELRAQPACPLRSCRTSSRALHIRAAAAGDREGTLPRARTRRSRRRRQSERGTFEQMRELIEDRLRHRRRRDVARIPASRGLCWRDIANARSARLPAQPAGRRRAARELRARARHRSPNSRAR